MRISQFLRIYIVSFISIFSLFVAQSNVSAISSVNTQNFSFTNFSADYYLSKAENGEAKLHVKEILTAKFPDYDQNHGITREIPRTNQNGANTTVKSPAALGLSVTRNGDAENFNISESDDYYTVQIGDASSYVHGVQTYTLEYDFTDVITEFNANGENVSGQDQADKAFQELYWDTNGTGWVQSFDQINVRLHLSPEILDKVSATPSCYVGKYGENGQNRCTIEKITDGYSFAASNLASRENLSFAIKFDPNTFRVVLEQNYTYVIFLLLEILIITIIIAFCCYRWRKFAKTNYDLYKKTFVAPEYLPPTDITIAEGEQLLIKLTKPSYVATLLELAVQQKITVQSVKGKVYDWVVTLNVAPESLTSSQVDLLQILAGGKNLATGTEIPISRHRATPVLAQYAQDYHVSAKKSLMTKGYFAAANPRRNHSTAIVILVSIIAVWLIFGLLAFLDSGIYELISPSQNAVIVGGPIMPYLIFLIMIAGVIVIAVLVSRTAKYRKYTEKGIKATRRLEGLSLYIKMAEAERLKFLQSVDGVDTTAAGIVKLYQELLPWACLFGLEKSWASELSHYCEVNNVDSELDSNLMYGIIVANIISDVNRSVIQSTHYANSSASSSSSGSSGGGFSGGGGGGGGGGGW